MSEKTRVHRPNSNTPRRGPAGRMIWTSTNYAWVPVDFTNPAGPQHFVRVGRGRTFRHCDQR